MGETGGASDEHASASGPNRRALLKGAVATGVGAAAWTAPNITTLGFAPAGAQPPCSVGTTPTVFETDCQSTNAGNPCQGFYQLNNTGNFGTGGTVTPNGNGCTDGTDTVTIVDPTGLRCRVQTLSLYSSNGCDPADLEQSAPSGSFDIPLLSVQPPNNKFWSMTIECVPTGACFPDEVTP